ncbi:hypothetical protein ACH4UM_39870 [Streptomyces sp. NPDC020801]|uniref:hypothetical protein n=1 Tax=unclassified Streptomyces TaxID=2593676 RepID=UPI0037B9FC45
MVQSTTATSELTSQYAAQVANDLERNIKEQGRISAEVAALQEQLAALQHDHSVLVNMQQALGISPAPVQSPATSDRAAVPAPRKKTSGEPGAGKRTRAKKAAGMQGPTATEEAAAQKSAGQAVAAKATQPTLVELVRRHLTEQNEPRSAAEVATALDAAHPERGIKTTVVRTTLEGLVAKNQAQRTKQGRSVFYTAPSPAQDTCTPAQDGPKTDQAA